MIPNIQLINVGNKRYEIVAQHNVNIFSEEDKERTKKIIKFYKKHYDVKEALTHPNNPGLYFFCNELIDAKVVEDNIYNKQQTEVSGSIAEK
jgi:hypothetical protein